MVTDLVFPTAALGVICLWAAEKHLIYTWGQGLTPTPLLLETPVVPLLRRKPSFFVPLYLYLGLSEDVSLSDLCGLYESLSYLPNHPKLRGLKQQPGDLLMRLGVNWAVVRVRARPG